MNKKHTYCTKNVNWIDWAQLSVRARAMPPLEVQGFREHSACVREHTDSKKLLR